MSDLLYIGDVSKPADILCVVDDEFKKYNLFDIGESKIALRNPTLVAEGIWLKMLVDSKEVGQTQVKFNNGVYHKGKTSSISTSWNATCHMDMVFNLSPLKLQASA
jgi:hypothetical protein